MSSQQEQKRLVQGLYNSLLQLYKTKIMFTCAVEVRLKQGSTISSEDVQREVLSHLKETMPLIRSGAIDFQFNSFLIKYVDKIFIVDLGLLPLKALRINQNCILEETSSDALDDTVTFWEAYFQIFVYSCEEEGSVETGDDNEDNTPSCQEWILPNKSLEGSWERFCFFTSVLPFMNHSFYSLVYEPGLKSRLLSFVETTLLFSESGVNPNLIGINRYLYFFCGFLILYLLQTDASSWSSRHRKDYTLSSTCTKVSD